MIAANVRGGMNASGVKRQMCLSTSVDDVVDAMLSYDAPNAVKIANGILAKYATFPPRDAVTSASTPRSVAETLKLFRPMQAEGISVCLPEIGMPALGRAVPG